MKKTLLLALLLGSVCMLHAYDLKNPALNIVEFKKAEKHAPIELIKNGIPQFALIADLHKEKGSIRGRSLRLSVDEWKLAIKKGTGKELEVFNSAQIPQALKKYRYIVVFGENDFSKKYIDFAKLKLEGFEVVTVPEGIIIAGRDSSVDPNFNKDPLDKNGYVRATMFGSYDVLERIFGLRFYMPGTGTIFPKLTNITITTPFRYTDYPRFHGRNGVFWINSTMSKLTKNSYRRAGFIDEWKVFLGDDLSMKWADWTNDRWRMGQTRPPFGGHDPHDKKFPKAYPDKLKTIFYQSPNGNFYYAPDEMIGNYYDPVNLEFVDLLIHSLKKYFDSKGKINDGWNWANNTYVTFGLTDHRINVADIEIDPVVRKLNLITDADKKRGAPLANVYGRFIQYMDRQMQKELPGKKLVVMAYYDIERASLDPRWKLSKNVEVQLCAGNFPGLAYNDKAFAEMEKEMAEWEAATGNPVRRIYGYNHNTNMYARAMIPEMTGYALKRWGKWSERDSLFFDHCAFYDFWNHFYSKYTMYRMMWNPDFNSDAAVKEMFEILYGKKASVSLVKFYRLLKKTFIECTKANDLKDILPPLTAVDQLEKYLKQAEKDLPADNEIAKKHFQLLAQRWPEAFTATRTRHSFNREVYGVHQLLKDGDIKVDGKEDAIWKDVKPIKLFCPYGSNKQYGALPVVKLAWDQKGIYGFAKMPYTVERKLTSMWNNDHFELFISPGTKQENYFHMTFDPNGHHTEKQRRFQPIPQPYGNWLANGYVYKTITGKKEWTAEFFVPYSAMGVKAPAAYDSWLANVCHTKKSGKEEYCSSSMTLGHNHEVAKYSIIKFSGKGE